MSQILNFVSSTGWRRFELVLYKKRNPTTIAGVGLSVVSRAWTKVQSKDR
jgi:hypothetical protein